MLVALPSDLDQGPKEFRFKGVGCKKAAEGVWGVGWCVCVCGRGVGVGGGLGGLWSPPIGNNRGSDLAPIGQRADVCVPQTPTLPLPPPPPTTSKPSHRKLALRDAEQCGFGEWGLKNGPAVFSDN